MNTANVERIKAFYASKGSLDKAAARIELMRDMYVGADLGDWKRWLQATSEETIAYEADGLPYGGTYKGLEGLHTLVSTMYSHWAKVEYEVKEFCAGGDFVVVLVDTTFTTKKSGRTFTMPCSEVWKFENDKIVELRLYYYDSHYTREAYLEGEPAPYARGSKHLQGR